MDSKSLIIGRESTTVGWATYESAVTESVYERSVAKDARNKAPEKSRFGSGIRRGTRNSKVGRKSTGEVDISPFSEGYDLEHLGSPFEVVSQAGVRVLAARGSHGPWHSP